MHNAFNAFPGNQTHDLVIASAMLYSLSYSTVINSKLDFTLI